VRVEQVGFRTRELVVVTTLLDAEKYAAAEVAKLYRRRGKPNSICGVSRSCSQMDHLRCREPHRVRNEFFMHLVAYNLIRKVMAIAASAAGVEPWAVSFKRRAADDGAAVAVVGHGRRGRGVVRRPAGRPSPATSSATAPTVSSRGSRSGARRNTSSCASRGKTTKSERLQGVKDI